jgi:hypothetical protein
VRRASLARDLRWQADNQRITRQWERDREAIGPRALSCQLAEFACGSNPGDLAELLAFRMLGEPWHFVPGDGR